MTGRLDGIRVVDFGRFVAAPYCGMLLAERSATPIRRPLGSPPRLGEHTDAVLKELGFSEDEVASFRLAEVV